MGNNSRLSFTPTALLMAVASVIAIALSCGGPGGEKNRQEGAMQERSIEVVLTQHTDGLMSLPGVVGTAIGECDGKPCIKVMVVKKSPELLKKIPSTLEGYPVEIDETGEFRALDSQR